MSELQLKPKVKGKAEERALPLVVEILPGQASEGLIDIFEPGFYEGKTLRQLVERTLNRTDLTIEERQALEDIQRQLAGGKLLSGGREVDGRATEYARMEETQEGERYLYVPVRAVKPQEGGSRA